MLLLGGTVFVPLSSAKKGRPIVKYPETTLRKPCINRNASGYYEMPLEINVITSIINTIETVNIIHFYLTVPLIYCPLRPYNRFFR